MSTKINIKMKEGCEDLFPAKAHASDAAWDLRSAAALELPVKRSTLVPTGVFIELPENFEAQIRPRSGLALKHDLMLTNSPGTIDAGYRGEVGVILANFGSEPFKVEKGSKIAQIVVAPCTRAEIEETVELDATERGEGGFGSTGV